MSSIMNELIERPSGEDPCIYKTERLSCQGFLCEAVKQREQIESREVEEEEERRKKKSQLSLSLVFFFFMHSICDCLACLRFIWMIVNSMLFLLCFFFPLSLWSLGFLLFFSPQMVIECTLIWRFAICFYDHQGFFFISPFVWKAYN